MKALILFDFENAGQDVLDLNLCFNDRRWQGWQNLSILVSMYRIPACDQYLLALLADVQDGSGGLEADKVARMRAEALGVCRRRQKYS